MLVEALYADLPAAAIAAALVADAETVFLTTGSQAGSADLTTLMSFVRVGRDDPVV